MKIGVQLYTLRQYGKDKKSLETLFANVKKMGYDTVQYSGCATFPKEIKTEDLKKIADDNGIRICLTHVSYDRIIHDTDNLAKQHLLLGCPTIGLGSMPKEPRTSRNEMTKFISEMNTASKKLAEYGLSLAYHNHDLEFKKLGNDLLFDILINEFDKNILFTMDTYWVKCAKHDPIEWMKKLDGRIKDLHIKDWSDDLTFFDKFIWKSGCKMCPIGDGKIDFTAIFEQAKNQGVENAFIELDIAKKPYVALEKSTAHIKKILNGSLSI